MCGLKTVWQAGHLGFMAYSQNWSLAWTLWSWEKDQRSSSQPHPEFIEAPTRQAHPTRNIFPVATSASVPLSSQRPIRSSDSVFPTSSALVINTFLTCCMHLAKGSAKWKHQEARSEKRMCCPWATNSTFPTAPPFTSAPNQHIYSNFHHIGCGEDPPSGSCLSFAGAVLLPQGNIHSTITPWARRSHYEINWR